MKESTLSYLFYRSFSSKGLDLDGKTIAKNPGLFLSLLTTKIKKYTKNPVVSMDFFVHLY